MAYADYQFYTEKYYGDTVPESDFPKYAERASDRIDAITFDRLVNGFPEEERAVTKVKKAVCAVAEALYQIDQIKKASMESVGTITRRRNSSKQSRFLCLFRFGEHFLCNRFFRRHRKHLRAGGS